MYDYFLSNEAKDDLKRIYYYGISKFGLDQADRYFSLIHDCFERIEENPFLFPSARHIKVGYRYCVCGVDTIYYRIVSDNRIEIISIIGRQNFSKSLPS
ncbi:type II toxin-antitoxin system RelE/ParE family toxin [Flavobacterium daemonense]|uniref:type II toxin-antitoxin system RelE/ParE family toxin n=1 Tax=Flavobacterium daemonense TaxID=1393049 RepID=UPI0011864E68|nr:type II toxin-antitoxin system RelE/ParE family toxin [Flavobacterium daemonense]KAF2327217.1 type II toxin-antitoxin system RelE/ParE family toxin [Flavobacterium daemonense]